MTSKDSTSQPENSELVSQDAVTNHHVTFSPQDLLLVEAILFAAGTRISTQRIMLLSKINDHAKVDMILKSLAQKHNVDHSAFELMHMGDDWKLTVKKPFLSVAEKIAPDAELPKSIIETLAILAWKAPMTQSDLVKIRSNKAYDHIEELQSRGFINREKRGRTYILKLTPKFFDYFDVQGKKQVEKLFDKFEMKDLAVVERQKSAIEKQKQELADKEAAAAATMKTLGQAPAENEVTLKKIKHEHKSKQKEFFDDIDSRLNQIVNKTSSVKDAIAEIAKSDTVSVMNATEEGVVSGAQHSEADLKVVEEAKVDEPPVIDGESTDEIDSKKTEQ